MGLLDGVIGSMAGGGRPAQKPGMGSTVAAGVVLALLVKGVRSYQANQAASGEGRSFDPHANAGQPHAAPAGGGGLGGMLGGVLGGGGGGAAGGLGGLLSGLGGAGALGALVGQLQKKGMGPQVNSWVGQGQNQPIAPEQLAQAIDEDDLQQLEQQTGMPRQALLAELAQTLPEAVHELTPDGRLPNDDEELHQIAAAAGARPA